VRHVACRRYTAAFAQDASGGSLVERAVLDYYKFNSYLRFSGKRWRSFLMHDGNESTEGAEVMVRKRRKGIYILPNLFTLAALFGGFYSIVMAMNGRFDLAAVGVFCAMVLDSLDGRVARMTNTQSAFGEQMDSLSDMVSFGAAPALIAYEWSLRGLGRWGWIAAFVYCACAALRLARFNVNTSVVDKRYFQGLPSPAAAALVAGFIWLMTELGVRRGEDLWLTWSQVTWIMFAFTLYSASPW
jgi:CDP-diacylglycerol--serine O-phosphatidyltransferase